VHLVATAIKRLAKRALLPPSGAHSMPVGIGRGIRMNFDFSRNARLYVGLYEVELNRHLRRLLKPGTTAFDVGAQLGYDSLVIAGLTRSAVAAFECDPACVGVMERNLALNPGLADVVEVVPRAVGDGPDQIGVDDYAYSELGFVPGFIKVDVDGGELAVLRSASRVLSERHPALIVETHSHDLENDCGRLLVEHGYRPIIVNQRRLLPDERYLDLNRWLVAW
jgi:hypothetical protein